MCLGLENKIKFKVLCSGFEKTKFIHFRPNNTGEAYFSDLGNSWRPPNQPSNRRPPRQRWYNNPENYSQQQHEYPSEIGPFVSRSRSTLDGNEQGDLESWYEHEFFDPAATNDAQAQQANQWGTQSSAGYPNSSSADTDMRDDVEEVFDGKTDNT